MPALAQVDLSTIEKHISWQCLAGFKGIPGDDSGEGQGCSDNFRAVPTLLSWVGNLEPVVGEQQSGQLPGCGKGFAQLALRETGQTSGFFRAQRARNGSNPDEGISHRLVVGTESFANGE